VSGRVGGPASGANGFRAASEKVARFISPFRCNDCRANKEAHEHTRAHTHTRLLPFVSDLRLASWPGDQAASGQRGALQARCQSLCSPFGRHIAKRPAHLSSSRVNSSLSLCCCSAASIKRPSSPRVSWQTGGRCLAVRVCGAGCAPHAHATSAHCERHNGPLVCCAHYRHSFALQPLSRTLDTLLRAPHTVCRLSPLCSPFLPASARDDWHSFGPTASQFANPQEPPLRLQDTRPACP